MWDLPGPGLKPVSPALAGGFLTTAPPGKSLLYSLLYLTLSLGIMLLGFIHGFACVSSLFLFYCWVVLHGIVILQLFIHSFTDIWISSTFWMLWRKLLWTFEYKSLHGHMFSVFLGKDLGMGLLGHVVSVCMFYLIGNWETVFQSDAACGIFFFLVVACGLLSCGMRTLSCGIHARSSSPTRDWTRAPCIGNRVLNLLDHQGSPSFS